MKKPTPLTPAKRKRMERERKRNAGLVPKEIWIKPNQWPLVQEFIHKLKGKSK